MKKLAVLIIIFSMLIIPLLKAQKVSHQFDAKANQNKREVSFMINHHQNNYKTTDATTYMEDSSYYMMWQNNAWKDYWKYVYTYTPFGKIAEEKDYSWDEISQIYNNYEKYTYTYNAQNQQVLHTFLALNVNNIWEDKDRTYSFYSNNLKVVDSSVFFNSSTLLWEIQSKASFVYDANNNLTSETYYNWNQTNNSWDNGYKVIYTNNTSGKPVELLGFNAGISSWDTSYRTTFTYNTNGYIIDQTTYNWDAGAHIWKTSVKLVYSYNTNSQLLNISRWQMNYNTGILQEVRRDGFSYDSNNNNTSINTTIWNSSAWVNAEKYINYWSLHQINAIDEQSNHTVKVFPNPATNTIYLNYYSNKPLNVRLFDVNGKLVTDKLITGNMLDISDLESGIYFVRLGNSVTKIIKK